MISVDQFSADLFDEYRPQFTGGLARLADGTAFRNGYQAHAATETTRVLRVCADPNNLPFSNQQREGFENKIADLVADRLHAKVEYVWWAQRRGFIRNTLRAGACGFLLKDASEDRLTTAIRVVSDGGSMFAPSVTRRLIEEFARREHPRPHPSLDGLTEREVDVLRQVARGLSNTEIAANLFVTENTVKTHIARLLRKLGIRDRVQAVVVAYESGLIVPSAEADQ